PYVCILTSRGCPYRCSYCASFQIYPQFTFREFLTIVEEIEFWQEKYGVINFAFYDDALLFEPKKRIIPFLKEIIRRKIKANFHTPNGMHLREINEEIAQLMVEAGFKTIRFGLETADEELMKKTGGKITRKEFIKGINCLHRAGFSPEQIGIYLLAGLPKQKAQEVEDSIHFVKDCGAIPYLAEYSPIPGTALWEEAVKNSRFDLINEPLFHNNSVFPCEWESFSRLELEKLKRLSRYGKSP
ncbi:MAG: radical SAM protein, partial [Desulfobacterota bacterium]|nr:radical SAM protein [Thermodesulfobacteriota bacterium]